MTSSMTPSSFNNVDDYSDFVFQNLMAGALPGERSGSSFSQQRVSEDWSLLKALREETIEWEEKTKPYKLWKGRPSGKKGVYDIRAYPTQRAENVGKYVEPVVKRNAFDSRFLPYFLKDENTGVVWKAWCTGENDATRTIFPWSGHKQPDNSFIEGTLDIMKSPEFSKITPRQFRDRYWYYEPTSLGADVSDENNRNYIFVRYQIDGTDFEAAVPRSVDTADGWCFTNMFENSVEVMQDLSNQIALPNLDPNILQVNYMRPLLRRKKDLGARGLLPPRNERIALRSYIERFQFLMVVPLPRRVLGDRQDEYGMADIDDTIDVIDQDTQDTKKTQLGLTNTRGAFGRYYDPSQFMHILTETMRYDQFRNIMQTHNLPTQISCLYSGARGTVTRLADIMRSDLPKGEKKKAYGDIRRILETILRYIDDDENYPENALKELSDKPDEAARVQATLMHLYVALKITQSKLASAMGTYIPKNRATFLGPGSIKDNISSYLAKQAEGMAKSPDPDFGGNLDEKIGEMCRANGLLVGFYDKRNGRPVYDDYHIRSDGNYVLGPKLQELNRGGHLGIRCNGIIVTGSGDIAEDPHILPAPDNLPFDYYKNLGHYMPLMVTVREGNDEGKLMFWTKGMRKQMGNTLGSDVESLTGGDKAYVASIGLGSRPRNDMFTMMDSMTKGLGKFAMDSVSSDSDMSITNNFMKETSSAMGGVSSKGARNAGVRVYNTQEGTPHGSDISIAAPGGGSMSLRSEGDSTTADGILDIMNSQMMTEKQTETLMDFKQESRPCPPSNNNNRRRRSRSRGRRNKSPRHRNSFSQETPLSYNTLSKVFLDTMGGVVYE
jgi:hypothetical protein